MRYSLSLSLSYCIVSVIKSSILRLVEIAHLERNFLFASHHKGKCLSEIHVNVSLFACRITSDFRDAIYIATDSDFAALPARFGSYRGHADRIQAAGLNSLIPEERKRYVTIDRNKYVIIAVL